MCDDEGTNGIASIYPGAMPDNFFRHLSLAEVSEFEAKAREDFAAGKVERTKLGIFHPAYRNEIARLDMETAVAANNSKP